MDRETQIAERRKQMPEIYRKTYDKAVRRKSLRAAATSFCLECVGYQREEVKLCTDLGCPLYLYRPVRGAIRGPKRQQKSASLEQESANSARQVVG